MARESIAILETQLRYLKNELGLEEEEISQQQLRQVYELLANGIKENSNNGQVKRVESQEFQNSGLNYEDLAIF